ncbi:hypothetical protein Agub_g10312 [Astrephomene gubernaculifera]|uniref:Uncharacterized protein n=1 Tax=Astrephomene gubernaculifera TaxID=47775 RepID=A0AAD3DX87_9CHLO|nr:hypothetical protein Agub_g10312 [Astrephomene gubernaculifera]
MSSRNVGGNGNAPEEVGGLPSAPTLDQVYAAIMSRKNNVQELPGALDAAASEAAARFHSGLGGSLRTNTLEQLLLQGLAPGADDSALGGPLSVMRSNTMEGILRDAMSGGRELQDLMGDWNHQQQQQQRQQQLQQQLSGSENKFVEGLLSDMEAIDAAPPDVHTLRRTFTLERLLSGGESESAGSLLRAGSPALPNQLQQQHQLLLLQQAQQQQQQALLPQRQHSGAAGAVAGGGGGDAAAGGGDGGAAAQGMRASGARSTERLQRQESLHRLAASSGPGQLPRPGSSGGPMGPPATRGPPAGGSLLRAATGSGRYGAAASAAIAEDDGAVSRSPKRLKQHHHLPVAVHLKSEAAAGGGGGGGGMAAAPQRSWSQSLLDLAKAAAALDGCDLDEVEGGHGAASAAGGKEGEGRDRQLTQPQQRRGAEVEGGAGERGRRKEAVAERLGNVPADTPIPLPPQCTAVPSAAAAAAGVECGPAAGEQQQGGSQNDGGAELPGGVGGKPSSPLPASVSPAAAATAATGAAAGGAVAAAAAGIAGVAGASGGGGEGGAGEEAPEGAAAAAAVQLLRSLSGPLLLKPPAGSQGAMGGGAGEERGRAQAARGGAAGGGGEEAAVAASSPDCSDWKLLQQLRSEAARLSAFNSALQEQQEAVLRQVEVLQARNTRMKQTLLEACHAKGIHADMELLHVSLQHHRAQPLPEAQAAQLAAALLGRHGGDLAATVQQMLALALGPGGGAGGLEGGGGVAAGGLGERVGEAGQQAGL